MYKVRVVEHIYKLKTEDDGVKEKLWDTKVYNVTVEADSKNAAKKVAITKVYSEQTGYVHKFNAGKVWAGTVLGVCEPEEKDVCRDENWRETIKEMA